MSIYLSEPSWSIKSVSEDCLLVEWRLKTNEPVNPKLAARISSITHYLLDHHADKIINVTPAYLTILIQFDIFKADEQLITKLIAQSLDQDLNVDVESGTLHQIPVFYDSSVAVDLNKICAGKGITHDQLIELHGSVIYAVYAVGFLPGFAYLGNVPEQLSAPRHESFRGTVPAGSVAIADRQTAVYPTESPGGWQVIGRTPKQLLVNHQSLLQAGDQVQFHPIDRDEFLALGAAL